MIGTILLDFPFNYGPGPYDSILPYLGTFEDDAVSSDKYVVAYDHGPGEDILFRIPSVLPLERMEVIVRDDGIRTNQYVIAYGDRFSGRNRSSADTNIVPYGDFGAFGQRGYAGTMIDSDNVCCGVVSNFKTFSEGNDASGSFPDNGYAEEEQWDPEVHPPEYQIQEIQREQEKHA